MAGELENFGESAWYTHSAITARLSESLDRIESACGVAALNHRDVLEEAARLTVAEARRAIILLDRAAADGAFPAARRDEPAR